MTVHEATKASTEQDLWGPFSIAGRSALVTGGGKGIGRGIAARFVEGGANVVIADLDVAAAERTAEALHSHLGRSVAMRADVANEEDCRAAVQRCVDEFGSIDILVNDAGIFPTSPVLEMSAGFVERVMHVNLRGLIFMSQAAGRKMVEQGRSGKIVNIASIDSVHPSLPGLAAYDASKGGMLMFTRSFALEMAPYGITVNAIAPGGITTEGTSQPLVGMTAEQMAAMSEAFVQRIPLRRMGDPDDILNGWVLAYPACQRPPSDGRWDLISALRFLRSHMRKRHHRYRHGRMVGQRMAGASQEQLTEGVQSPGSHDDELRALHRWRCRQAPGPPLSFNN